MLRGQISFLVLMIFAFPPVLAQGNQNGLETFLEDYIPFASVGQAFMGPLGGGHQAVTSLLVTNVSLQARDLGMLFHHGVHVPEEFPVFINGEEGAFFSETIPSGGVRRFELTAGEFSQGAIALGFRDDGSPVVEDVILSVASTSFITTLPNEDPGAKIPSRGSTPRDLSEAFSSAVNDADAWLCSGFCWAISTTEGVGPASIRQRLGVAVSSVVPGQSAPEGAQLRFFVYDADGRLFASRDLLVDGSHTAFFPGALVEQVGDGTMIFCLESSDAEYKMDLTVIRVNQLREGTVQFDQLIFTDGFESGDISAWTGPGN